jgi:oxygen-independent coproporphyrinogen-3 oxidase
MLEAICAEIAHQQNYLPTQVLQSIYFGGGTPSLLSMGELEKILSHIQQFFTFDNDIEITLEANPDDINLQKLKDFRALGINRLSIGIQTFDEAALTYLNRAHNGQMAHTCLQQAQAAGFDNLTADLMYALPTVSFDRFRQDVSTLAVQYQIPHISIYGLTIEPNTVFGRKKVMPQPEEIAAQQFEYLMDFLRAEGYVQYEISNFGKPGYFAKHNSMYWRNVPYLGIGPSAHSFDGRRRQYNIANNALYAKALLHTNTLPATIEQLSPESRANELIMTGLRTIWGMNPAVIQQETGLLLGEEQQQAVQRFEKQQLLLQNDEVIILTQAGKLLADQLAADLFFDT